MEIDISGHWLIKSANKCKKNYSVSLTKLPGTSDQMRLMLTIQNEKGR